jgi:hypothetical protein
MNFTSSWTRWPGSGLLIALPAAVVALVPLGGRQPIEIQALEDPPHPGVADLDVVVAPEVHGDLGWAEVVVLAQVDDLAHDLGAGGVGADLGPVGAVPEPVQAVLVIALAPLVEHLAADAVVAAGQGDVAGDLRSMTQDRQTPLGATGQLLLGHEVSSLVGDPKCQPSPSVPDSKAPHEWPASPGHQRHRTDSADLQALPPLPSRPD